MSASDNQSAYDIVYQALKNGGVHVISNPNDVNIMIEVNGIGYIVDVVCVSR